MDDAVKDPKVFLKDQLELPRAVLLQLRDTRLFNSLLDKAIQDIDDLLMKGPKE